MDDKLIDKHKNFLLRTGNPLIKKYFGIKQIFHDCHISNWKYKPNKSVLEYTIKQSFLMDILKVENIEYKIIFKRIFEIKFLTVSLVDEDDLDLDMWKNYFLPKRKSDFLYCLFDKSNYTELPKKLEGIEAIKGRLFFDSGLNVELDFLDLNIIEPDIMKNRDIIDLLK